MKKQSLLLGLLAAFGALLLLVNVVAAQQPGPSDDEVNAVAKELYCPVCENIPLDVCPTTACAQWRDLIREKLAAGWSKDQIKQYFVDQYGDRVLPAPPRRGLHWLVYILPLVSFAAGVWIVVRIFSRMRSPAASASAAEPAISAPSDDYLARVEAELKQRE